MSTNQTFGFNRTPVAKLSYRSSPACMYKSSDPKKNIERNKNRQDVDFGPGGETGVIKKKKVASTRDGLCR